MNTEWTQSTERSAFAALVALVLAPVIAQGLWRPLVHVFGPAGDAAAVTGVALAIGGVVVLVRRLRVHRAPLVALGLGVAAALLAALGLALGVAGAIAGSSVALATALLTERVFPSLPTSLDGLARRHKGLAALYTLIALLSLTSVARTSVFMGDPTQVHLQVLPGEKFLETHSCLTAYVHADTLSRAGVDNLYDPKWWHGAGGLPPLPPGVESPYRPFILDYYAYPPPFLLVMAPLAPLDGDYPAQRALWFGLNGLLLAAGLWIVARFIDGPNAHRVLLLAPVFFASLPVLVTLQVGNFQIAVVILAVLSMVAFHRGRDAAGGALLAFSILSKISPGVLGIVLLAKRRWRSAAAAAAFGLLFFALSATLLGVDPIASFLTFTLPRLTSGEVFAFLDDEPFSIVTNMSIFGLPFKLQLLGLEIHDPWAMGRALGRVYTVFLCLLAVKVALRDPGDRRTQAVTWMSLLVLAALQSPFAPGYTLIALLWALTLVATEVTSLRGGVTLALLWLGLAVVIPWPDLSMFAAQSILQSALAVGVSCWLLLRPRPRPAPPA